MFWLIACLTPYPIVTGPSDCLLYADADGDGFGDPARCLPPGATDGVPDAGDCDDADSSVFPGAEEFCDGVDQDCDLIPDNDAVDADLRYVDADGDSFGDPSRQERVCPMDGWVQDNQDCNDQDDSIYPGAPELCDDADRNCDGDPYDNPDDGVLWYFDNDGDGYGRKQDFTDKLCEPPDGNVATGDDCNDNDFDVNPAQTAFFDEPTSTGSYDYDCDGLEEQEYPDLPVCDSDDNLIGPGYVSGPPGCGNWGWWAEYCISGYAFGLGSYPDQACR